MKSILSLLLLTFLCQATSAVAGSKKPSLRGLKSPGSQAITHLEESRLEVGGSSTATTPGTASSVVSKEGNPLDGAKDEVENSHRDIYGENQRRKDVDVHETHGHEIGGILAAEQDLPIAVKKQEEGAKDAVDNQHDLLGDNQ